MSNDLFIRNVRPMAGAAADVHVRDGRIAAIGPDLAAPAGVEVLDGGGAILTPGLVEAHTHLDKSLWGMGWRPHDAGPRLIDKIDNERRLKKLINIDPARQSARQVVQSSRMGSTAIRSHVDVDTEIGLWGMEGVLQTRADYADIMDIDIVAFPQSGLMIRPGTADLLDQAMKMGADVVGGLDPCAIDRDPKGQLDVVFGLAERYGKPVDIHLHEGGTMGAFSMDLIIERTRALGMTGKVTVSHAFCLGDPDPALVDPLIAALAELDIAIMTTGPASRPAPPIAKLAAAGVRICSGSDGIRDTWGPYGNADMLERAMFLGLRNNFRKDEEVELAFDVVTHGGARVMGLAGYGLEVGCRADLLIVPGTAITEAVVSRPSNRIVIKRGRVVARDGAVLREAP
ncbi:cytosine deaminase [Prosthecomicrobium hirschii]|uniref:amidohydrolase family protein n=1 Tax=Prosthecodimorpha hirschii TaxID=665126 RepID=UPI0011265455|nr:amidohydrolase family protein [Prosthecomicrobium hirschii]TPQ52052.1 cytosine deaminase [Prosthecomicrobium hirschii]